MKLNSIYTSSVGPSSGKTEIALGLGLKLQEAGYTVGYFKPFGRRKGKSNIDPEIDVLAKTFHMTEEETCPCFLDNVHFEAFRKQDRDELLARIVSAYKAVRDRVDVVIVEGLKQVNTLISFDLDDAKLASALDCKVLSVNVLETDHDVDDLVMQRDLLVARGAGYLGCVFNKVSKFMTNRAREEFLPFLEGSGIKTFGIVELDERLTAPTVREVLDNISGKLLDEDESSYNMDALVQNVLVGAMSAHSALSYFRTAGKNSVVITGGDRADIVLTALESSSIVAIILTGGLYPDMHVVSAAREKGVPIILVSFDTFTTANKVEATTAELQLHERQLCKEIVEKGVDIDALVAALK